MARSHLQSALLQTGLCLLHIVGTNSFFLSGKSKTLSRSFHSYFLAHLCLLHQQNWTSSGSTKMPPSSPFLMLPLLPGAPYPPELCFQKPCFLWHCLSGIPSSREPSLAAQGGTYSSLPFSLSSAVPPALGCKDIFYYGLSRSALGRHNWISSFFWTLLCLTLEFGPN